MSIKQRTAYAVLKAISIIKLASDLSSGILMAMHVRNDVNMIGLISLATWLSITSVEYTSLKDKTQVALGISIEIGEVMTIMIITSSMIYLVNADQSRNNNTMTRT